ncbi:MAG: hypothetical protein AB7Q81_10175 [Gammaproteobacteria bacterium]
MPRILPAALLLVLLGSVAPRASASTIGQLCCSGGQTQGPIPLTFTTLGLEVSGVTAFGLDVIGTIFLDPAIYTTVGQLAVVAGTPVYTTLESIPAGLVTPDPNALEAELRYSGPGPWLVEGLQAERLLITAATVDGLLLMSATGGVVALGATVRAVPLAPAVVYLLGPGVVMAWRARRNLLQTFARAAGC